MTLDSHVFNAGFIPNCALESVAAGDSAGIYRNDLQSS